MFLLWWNAEPGCATLNHSQYLYRLFFDHEAPGQRVSVLSFMNCMLGTFCRWFLWWTFSLPTSGDYILRVRTVEMNNSKVGIITVEKSMACKRLMRFADAVLNFPWEYSHNKDGRQRSVSRLFLKIVWSLYILFIRQLASLKGSKEELVRQLPPEGDIRGQTQRRKS